jgi:hypothetical protein
MDYKRKYLKYKQKYFDLKEQNDFVQGDSIKQKYFDLKEQNDFVQGYSIKQKYISLKGGDEIEEGFEKICNFSRMVKIGEGQEGKVYKKNDCAYKVYHIINKQKLKSVWDRPLRIGGAGTSYETFCRSYERYKKAGELELGPKIHGYYFCDLSESIKLGVIIMDYIDGRTVRDIKGSMNEADRNILIEKIDEFRKRLEDLDIIDRGGLSDAHDANFMIDKSGKLYGIDF